MTRINRNIIHYVVTKSLWNLKYFLTLQGKDNQKRADAIDK